MGLDASLSICDRCYEIGTRLESENILSKVQKARERLGQFQRLRLSIVSDNISSLRKIVKDEIHVSPVEDIDEKSFCPYVLLVDEMEVELYLSDGSYKDYQWEEILLRVDFFLLAVSASHMLTASEKGFIEKQVKTYLGCDRFSVIITDMERLNSLQALEDTENRMAQYLAGQGMAGQFLELGMETVGPFIRELLPGRKDELRSMLFWRNAYLCCCGVEEDVKQMQKISEIDAGKLKAQIDQLEGRREEMCRKGKIAAGLAYQVCCGKITVRSVSYARSYMAEVDRELCKELEEPDRPELSTTFVQERIEAEVGQMALKLENIMQEEIEKLVDEVKVIMQRDAREFFSDMQNLKLPLLANYPEENEFGWLLLIDDITGMAQEVSAKASQEKADKISKMMAIGAIPALIIGSIPLAVGTLAVSQLVKKIKIPSAHINADDMRAFIHKSCQEVESFFEGQIKNKGRETGEEAEKVIFHSYETFVSQILQKLSQLVEKTERTQQKLGILKEIENIELPVLKKTIENVK